MPLVQRSTKSNPLAQDRRSIILVQITGPHQGQQHLLVMLLHIRRAWVSPIAWIHVWRKGSTVETVTKSWAGQQLKSMANSLSTSWTRFSTTGAWQLLNQSAAIYYLALKETPKNIPLTLILGAGCHPSFVRQNWNCVICSKKGLVTCDKR